MITDADKNQIRLDPPASAVNWSEIALLCDLLKDCDGADVLLPYWDDALTERRPGDCLAVAIHGLVQPRQLVVTGRGAVRDCGLVRVYLGILAPDDDALAAAVFCDQAPRESAPGMLRLDVVPFKELTYVARVIGRAAINKPFQDLQAWQFGEHERLLVEQAAITEHPNHQTRRKIYPFLLRAFDDGGMQRRVLPKLSEGSNSVH